MEKTLDLQLPDYLVKNVLCEYFEDQLVVVEFGDTFVSAEEKAGHFPARLQASAIILVLSGELDIEVNYVRHTLRKNTLMQLTDHDIILDISHSADFAAYLVIISPGLRSEIMSMTSGIRLPKSGQLKRAYPVQEFVEEEFGRIKGHVERIKFYISEETHRYRSPLIRNEVMNLYWNIDNSRWKKYGDAQFELTHSELLRDKFREMLVKECRWHRDVAFYAQELCVTPDYLSRVIREYDGASALKWITNAVVAEARYLMRQPGKTINQIALELNFPDQSTFGKYFKRHTGIAPKEYKNAVL